MVKVVDRDDRKRYALKIGIVNGERLHDIWDEEIEQIYQS